jgi:hypothetical protein
LFQLNVTELFVAVPQVMVGTIAVFTVTLAVVLLQPVAVLVKVNVTVPGLTPVITPALVTVAIPVLLLVQVPPEVGLTVPVMLMHIEEGAVTVGFGFTVTVVVVLLQVVVAFVKVKVALPALTPVITPALVTVATALLLLVHVPPVVGLNVAVLPTQTAAGAVTVGLGEAVMVTCFVSGQLSAPIDPEVTV